MKRSYVCVFVALATACIAVAATVVPVRMQEYSFSGAVTVPITNSDLQPLYLTAVEMSFRSAVSNTVVIEHITASHVTNILLNVSGTMQTLTWYVPRPLFLLGGDSLRCTNSVATNATLKLSVEKYVN